MLVLLATEKICRQHAFGTESLVGRQDSAGEAIQVYAAFVLLRSSLLGSKLCFFHCLAVPFVLANGLGPVDLLSQLLLASFDSFLLQAAQPPPPPSGHSSLLWVDPGLPEAIGDFLEENDQNTANGKLNSVQHDISRSSF